MNQTDRDRSTVEEMNRLVAEAGLAARLEAFWDGIYGWKVGEYRIPDPEMPLRPPSSLASRAAIVEKYFRDVEDYWFHLYKPQPGDVIVDIGAGRGEDVFVFSKAVGPSGEVWAVEPHPVSFLALSKLCEWNGLNNVKLFHCACTQTRQRLEIETLPVWESNYIRTGDPAPSSHTIQGLPFDAVAAEHGLGKVDYFKMNIEGAETEALPACAATLQRTRHCTIAAHDFRADRGEGEGFRTLAEVRTTLSTSGFTLTTRDSDARYYVPYHVHGQRP